MNGWHYQRYLHSLLPVIDILAPAPQQLAALLDGTGITVADLQLPDTLISRTQELAFFRNVVAQCGRPGLAIEVGAQISPWKMGAPGYAEMACRTAREAIELLKRYRCLTMPYMRWDTLVIGDEVVHRITDTDHLGELRPFISEMALAMLRNQSVALMGEGCQPTAVSFSYAAPDDIDCYTHYFGVEPSFNQRTTELRLPLAYLDCEREGYDAMVKSSMEQLCQTMASRLQREPDIVQEVTSILRSANEGMPSLEQIAPRVGLSPRTLRRRLQEKNTNFRILLDGVRRQRALEDLRRRELTIQAISERCGFSELHSFYNAFKRWTGTSPAQYRAEQFSASLTPVVGVA